jgi:hypothetical protein
MTQKEFWLQIIINDRFFYHRIYKFQMRQVVKNLRLACFTQFVFSFQEREIIKSAKMNFSTVDRQNFLRYIATLLRTINRSFS